MDSDAPRSGHSEDVFGFTMVRVLRKIQPIISIILVPVRATSKS